MGLEIQLDVAVPYNPNLNPLPVLRDYDGVADGLLGVFHFDNSPTPRVPVAGSATAPGLFSGTPTQSRAGYKFKGNQLLDTLIVPGSGVSGLTMFCVARRTGVQPPGATDIASPICIGTTPSAAFRLELNGNGLLSANTAVPIAPSLYDGDGLGMWDFYAVTYTTTGSKLYRPRITPAPVSTSTDIADIGAPQLDLSFRIGSAGTNLPWSECEVMVAGIAGVAWSDADVIDQFEWAAAYAAAKGVVLGGAV